MKIFVSEIYVQAINDYEVINDWFYNFLMKYSTVNKDLLNEIWMTRLRIQDTEKEIMKEKV